MIAAAAAGCQERNKVLALPNGCTRVIFYNAVAADIRAEKIDHISIRQEAFYSDYVGEVVVVLPRTPKLARLGLLPLENKEDLPAGCRLLENGHSLCWRKLDKAEANLAFDVVFEVPLTQEKIRPQLMSEVNDYLRREVLNCD